MRALGVVALLSLGCASAPRVQVLTALTPVDASRPYFLYGPVEGNACGEGAETRAFDDLFRLAPVDGFVAVVVAQDPKKNCVRVTARPITYGCEPRTFGPAATRESVHIVPGPASCPGAQDTCAVDCASFASRLGAGETETAAYKDRCLLRCKNGEAGFITCAKSAASAADVRKCDSQSSF